MIVEYLLEGDENDMIFNKPEASVEGDDARDSGDLQSQGRL
jgi:hypothetical protein